MENFKTLEEISFEVTWNEALIMVIEQSESHLTSAECSYYLNLIGEMSQADSGNGWVKIMAKMLAKKFGFAKYQLITTYTDSGEIFREIIFPKGMKDMTDEKKLELTWEHACIHQIHSNRFTPEEHEFLKKLFEAMFQVDSSSNMAKIMAKLLAKKFGFTKYQLISAYTESGDIFREIVFPEDDSVLRM